MSAFRVKLITANDEDIFQDRLNRFLENLSEDTVVLDIKFTSTLQGGTIIYGGLVQYKVVENW